MTTFLFHTSIVKLNDMITSSRFEICNLDEDQRFQSLQGVENGFGDFRGPPFYQSTVYTHKVMRITPGLADCTALFGFCSGHDILLRSLYGVLNLYKSDNTAST